MLRKAFVMAVHEGCEKEYELRHNPIWPELECVLLAHGVRSYSIFIHPITRQLFGYVEVESEDQWKRIAETEVCQRWWEYMAPLMPTADGNRPESLPLHEVFHLDSGNPHEA
ncbi:MAG: L-rhamnose mutarotase [Verrucomicrobia bacterium]|nr:L-rhamnose mutarotase [Verrucomicrobiota bacterium]